MTTRKVHLSVRRDGRTACGLPRQPGEAPLMVTTSPAAVTCGGCQRTEQMALAELQGKTRRRRNRPGSVH